jgi:chromosome segregation ATPase
VCDLAKNLYYFEFFFHTMLFFMNIRNEKMTRTKEVEPGSGDMPDYKSPPNRLVHSLRQGYDNLRVKLQDARNKIKYYQIKTRDLEQSRDNHKKEAAELKKKILKLEDEKENLKTELEAIEIKKKRQRN